jgi:hypothetical protein
VAKARSFIKSLAKFGYKQKMKEIFFKAFFATSRQPGIEISKFLIEIRILAIKDPQNYFFTFLFKFFPKTKC